MWLSVALEVDATHAESLSDALLTVGAISVSVEDAQAGSIREGDGGVGDKRFHSLL